MYLLITTEAQGEELDSPLPSPDLNFTEQIQSILDGESVGEPDSIIPDVLGDVTVNDNSNVTHPQSDVTNDLQPGSGINNEDQMDVDSPTPDSSEIGDSHSRNFLNLQPDQQQQLIYSYKQNMEAMKQQNDNLSLMVTTINEQREKQNKQMDEILKQNRELMDKLKDANSKIPTSEQMEELKEDLTKEIKADLSAEYDLKIKSIEDTNIRNLQVQTNKYKESLQMKEQ